MSTAIHLDRALILFGDEAGGAIAAGTNKAEAVSTGDACEHDAPQPSTRQKTSGMPRPLWIYYERL